MTINSFDENNSGQRESIPSQNFRIQSAMVLFALEEALGSYVVQAVPQPEALPSAMRSEIEKRIQGAGFVPVEQIIQETCNCSGVKLEVF